MPLTELVWVFTAQGGPLLLRRAGEAMAGAAQQLLSPVSFAQIRSGRDLSLR